MDIIYDDNYLTVVDKPHGRQCEPDKNGHPDLCGELRRRLNKLNRPPKILQPVNRLDRPVAGLVLFAKTATALRALNAMQEARQIQKTYTALLEGRMYPAEGVLSHFLLKDPAQKKALIFERATEGAKPCRLDYRTLEGDDEKSRVEIILGTGRYHQIRAQFGFAGYPVWGDTCYGAEHVYGDHAVCLHASRLRFLHPVSGEPVTAESRPAF